MFCSLKKKTNVYTTVSDSSLIRICLKTSLLKKDMK